MRGVILRIKKQFYELKNIFEPKTPVGDGFYELRENDRRAWTWASVLSTIMYFIVFKIKPPIAAMSG